MLIEGKPGLGKSTLALMLVDRGAAFVADDGVVLETRGKVLIASPVPATRGLLEVRNLGLIELPTAASVRVALVLTLSDAAPRFVENAGGTTIEGCSIPHLMLTPKDPALAIKAELALARYGLPDP